ncbi:MAG TPA: Hpt domain-containing protein [Xanthomonadaceae bacterium]|nr:Hpt domain-containing protein [Xanthomonadaceae bacterium]
MSEELLRIHAEYQRSLRAKHARLLALWDALRTGRGDDGTVVQLRTLLHHLSGSAGAYGYEVLGENAARLERTLADWIRDGSGRRCEAAALCRRCIGDYEETERALAAAIDAAGR